jgi:hypothetical protein
VVYFFRAFPPNLVHVSVLCHTGHVVPQISGDANRDVPVVWPSWAMAWPF